MSPWQLTWDLREWKKDMSEKSYLFRQAQNAKGNFRCGLLQGSKRSPAWEESTWQTRQREDKEEGRGPAWKETLRGWRVEIMWLFQKQTGSEPDKCVTVGQRTTDVFNWTDSVTSWPREGGKLAASLEPSWFRWGHLEVEELTPKVISRPRP